MFKHNKAALLLLNKGADPNKAAKEVEDRNVITPLHYAIYRESTEVVSSLLERGADPNKETRSTQLDGDVYEETPLYVAAKIGSTEIVRILLERGARQDLDGGGGEIG